MQGDAPAEFTRLLLAEHWHCTPSQVDAEDENDVALAVVLLQARAAHAAYQRFLAEQAQ